MAKAVKQRFLFFFVILYHMVWYHTYGITVLSYCDTVWEVSYDTIPPDRHHTTDTRTQNDLLAFDF